MGFRLRSSRPYSEDIANSWVHGPDCGNNQQDADAEIWNQAFKDIIEHWKGEVEEQSKEEELEARALGSDPPPGEPFRLSRRE